MLSTDLKAGLQWELHKADPARWVRDNCLLRDKAGVPVALDAEQVQVMNPQNRRVVLCCHRQYGKSTIASLVCFHRALFFEKSLCLLVAPSLRQSSENFRKVADALESISPPPVLEEDTKLTLKFANGSRIISLPGTQKTVRGFTAPDVIFVDEGSEVLDELFAATFPMIVRNHTGRMIVASTPKGQRGFFFRLWTEGGPEWLKIMKRASENDRIAPEVLEEARRALPDWVYRQEYECEFVQSIDQYFSYSTIQKMFDSDVKPLWGEA